MAATARDFQAAQDKKVNNGPQLDRAKAEQQTAGQSLLYQLVHSKPDPNATWDHNRFTDFLIGMGDGVSGGITTWVRQKFGYDDVVDHASLGTRLVTTPFGSISTGRCASCSAMVLAGGSAESRLVLTPNLLFGAALYVSARYPDCRSGPDNPGVRGAMVLDLSFIPAGVFFRMAYSELLFPLLCVLMLWLIERRASPILGAVVVALATVPLVRPIRRGIILDSGSGMRRFLARPRASRASDYRRVWLFGSSTLHSGTVISGSSAGS